MRGISNLRLQYSVGGMYNCVIEITFSNKFAESFMPQINE